MKLKVECDCKFFYKTPKTMEEYKKYYWITHYKKGEV